MKRLIVMVSVLIMLVTVIQAQEVLKIATFPIPVMVESSDKGVFINLVKKVAEKAGINIEIDVFPTPRAIASFMRKDYDMLFPALDIQFHGKELPHISSEKIYIKQDFGFVKKGNDIIRKIDDLIGKNIGITVAYPYSEDILFNKSLVLQKAPNDGVNVKKLINDRIDVFIVEEKSGLGAFANANVSDFSYDPTAPLSKQNVYFAFQKTERGRKLEKIFSKALSELKNDGTFGEIMKRTSK